MLLRWSRLVFVLLSCPTKSMMVSWVSRGFHPLHCAGLSCASCSVHTGHGSLGVGHHHSRRQCAAPRGTARRNRTRHPVFSDRWIWIREWVNAYHTTVVQVVHTSTQREKTHTNTNTQERVSVTDPWLSAVPITTRCSCAIRQREKLGRFGTILIILPIRNDFNYSEDCEIRSNHRPGKKVVD